MDCHLGRHRHRGADMEAAAVGKDAAGSGSKGNRRKTRGAIARAYSRLRTGKVFFIALAAFCGLWTAWNWLAPTTYRFDDPGFPLLTLILSIEASLAASAIIVAGEEAEVHQQEQLKYLMGIAQAILTLLENQRDNEVERQKDVRKV